MATARVIKTGKTQTLELLANMRLKGDSVEVVQRDNEVVLRDIKGPAPGEPTDWARVYDILGELTGEAPDDLSPQERPGL